MLSRRFPNDVREEKISLELWHEFSEEELRFETGEMIRWLDDEARRAAEEALRKKAFKDEMDMVRGQIMRVAQAIRARGEKRATPCVVRFHKPNVGTKQILREATGELVKEEPMTPSECQEHLFGEGTATA